MISQRAFEVLALSQKILTFLARHTTQIKARQGVCLKTLPLMELLNSLYEMVIMLHILLGGT